MRAVIRTIVGVSVLTIWATWLFMLMIGTLAGFDVVNGTVGFFQAIPLGLGFVLIGLLPITSLIVLAASPDKTEGPDLSPGLPLVAKQWVEETASHRVCDN